jgi:hypothetical protein
MLTRRWSLIVLLQVALLLALPWAGSYSVASPPTPQHSELRWGEDPEALIQPHCGGVVYKVGPETAPIPYARVAKSMPAPVLQEVGNGSITFAVDSSVDPDYHQYILDLLNEVYPYIVQVYGAPANTIQVTVHFDNTYPGWYFYSPLYNRITISAYPNISLPYDPANPNDPRWDSIMVHELIHAFHDDAVSLSASWMEEGMTEAAGELVAMLMYDAGARDVRGRLPQYNLLMYDTWSQMGADVLGGTTYSFYKAVPDLFYRAAPALFWLLTTGESSATAGSWADYQFLADLNAWLYSYVSQFGPYVDRSTFLSLLSDVAPEPVDGQDASQWTDVQPIANTDGPEGDFLGVYPSRWTVAGGRWIKTPTNPNRVYLFAFHRSVGSDPWDTQETPITGVTVAVTVENASGVVMAWGDVPLTSYYNYAGLNTSGWPPGGYRILASTIINSKTVTAQNSFLVGADIKAAQDGVGFVVTDVTGQLAGMTLMSPDGTFSLNQDAAAVLHPWSTTTIPTDVHVIGASTVSLPLPYTRVGELAVTVIVGDCDSDGDVDIADIQLAASHWRSPGGYDPDFDFNADGENTVADVQFVAAHWGAEG